VPVEPWESRWADYYALLRISPVTPAAMLPAAFDRARRCRVAHPSAAGARCGPDQLDDAWDVLNDADRRHRYDCAWWRALAERSPCDQQREYRGPGGRHALAEVLSSMLRGFYGQPRAFAAGAAVTATAGAPIEFEPGWLDARRDELNDALCTQAERARHAPSAERAAISAQILDLASALRRISHGEYGRCSLPDCAQPISPSALEARPARLTCHRCEPRWS